MSQRHVWGCLVGFASVALPLTAHGAGPSPELMARNCYTCHGPQGVSAGPMPPLKGLPADYIVQAMVEFKADKRPGTIMNRIAKGYSDENTRLLADYIASVK